MSDWRQSKYPVLEEYPEPITVGETACQPVYSKHVSYFSKQKSKTTANSMTVVKMKAFPSGSQEYKK